MCLVSFFDFVYINIYDQLFYKIHNITDHIFLMSYSKFESILYNTYLRQIMLLVNTLNLENIK